MPYIQTTGPLHDVNDNTEMVVGLRVEDINHNTIGSLSNDNGDVNKNGIKAIGLDWQNNNFAHVLHIFVHFFAITAPRT